MSLLFLYYQSLADTQWPLSTRSQLEVIAEEMWYMSPFLHSNNKCAINNCNPSGFLWQHYQYCERYDALICGRTNNKVCTCRSCIIKKLNFFLLFKYNSTSPMIHFMCSSKSLQEPKLMSTFRYALLSTMHHPPQPTHIQAYSTLRAQVMATVTQQQ